MRSLNTHGLRRSLLALVAVPVLALSACGGGGDAFEEAGTSSGSAGGGDLGTIVVGGAQFTEIAIMEEMYKLLLEDAGYTVEVKTAGQREIYMKSLADGEVDVVPEYAATLAEYFNREANGPEAEAIATSDADETVAAMQSLAEEQGLLVLDPAEAVDANGFYVTQAYADENSLTTLSDLGALGQPIVLAADDECLSEVRIYCAPGLEGTYGITVASVTGDEFGSATGKQKVVDGDAQVGLAGTTDGTLEGLGLIILEDDKMLQAADNLVPVVNSEGAGGDAEVAEALNKIAGVLTTEDLTQLNARVDGQREQAADVARDYLESKGLIG